MENLTSKKLMSTIFIDLEILEKIKKEYNNLEYLEKENFDQMPEGIKEMHVELLEKTQEKLENLKHSLIREIEITDNVGDNIYLDEDVLSFVEKFLDKEELLACMEDINSYKDILDSDLNLSNNVRKKIEDLYNYATENYCHLHKKFIDHINLCFKNKYISKRKADLSMPSGESRSIMNLKDSDKTFRIKKSALSESQIKQKIIDFLKSNRAMFDKIIYDSKEPTLHIDQRILDVKFKPGVGYIVNFISEPDTNIGKFYQNLLKVFELLQEEMYQKDALVVIPEDGKNLYFLNSFYQNYIFLKDTLQSKLTQYRLQHSMLNKEFDIKYLIFDKHSIKYMIFYTGDKILSESVLAYIQNQAKLGTLPFNLEFIKYNGNVTEQIAQRQSIIINKVDLIGNNNHLSIQNLSEDDNQESLFLEMSSINILINPLPKKIGNDSAEEYISKYFSNKLDVIILTNARRENLDILPKLMIANPEAKLFAADITYKIARIKWLNKLTNMGFSKLLESSLGYTKKDIDNINGRVIRITPKGSGYNFKNMVNIKFFNGGMIPGNSMVELRDAKSKLLYLSDVSYIDTGFMKGAEKKLSDYDYIVAHNKLCNPDIQELPLSDIENKLANNKQVFLFSDELGNLQNVLYNVFGKTAGKPIVAGDNIFSVINKEISKFINYGSNWTDPFKNKDLFIKSSKRVEPFIEEYEFYKKLSSDEPYLFILPFGKAEVDMVIKTKTEQGNLIIIPQEKENSFSDIIKQHNIDHDDIKSTDHTCFSESYNYLSPSLLQDLMNNTDAIFFVTGSCGDNNSNCRVLGVDKKIDIY